MTQQVIHCVVKLKSLDAEVDNPSYGFTFEATGADASFTFDNTSPIQYLLTLHDGTIGSYVINGGTAFAGFIGKYLAPCMSRAAGDVTVETYDITAVLGGAPVGSPLRVDTTTLQAAEASTLALPEGACIGLGWRAPYGSATEFAPGARPRSRYRNRCYFGPLVANAATAQLNGQGASRVGAAITADLVGFMQGLSTNNTTLTTNHKQWDLVAWSRKDATIRDAEMYSISERFDYQRRRTERVTPEVWVPTS